MENQDFESMKSSDQPHENPSSVFNDHYRVYPITFVGDRHLDNGNKIIMPGSAIRRLSTLDDIDYPMLFRLDNAANGRHSHCGVLEFTAEEGFAFLPTSMMANLKLNDGDLVSVRNASLPKGTFMKIQPHETKFLNLSDHKTLLENTLRDFACMTVGDTAVISHHDEKYHLDIVEAKPSPAISLFETDCEVEFARPLDYKEPEKKPIKRKKDDHVYEGDDDEDNVVREFKPFTGVAKRLDGEEVLSRNCNGVSNQAKKKVKVDDDKKKEKVAEGDEVFKPFSGVGRRLDGQQSEQRVGGVAEKKAMGRKEKDTEESRKFQPFTGKSFTTLAD